jgi:hypothetical protein
MKLYSIFAYYQAFAHQLIDRKMDLDAILGFTKNDLIIYNNFGSKNR